MTTTFTGISFYLDYRSELDLLDVTFDQIQKGALSSLGKAVWNYDAGQTEALLNGLIKINDIIDIRVVDHKGQAIYQVQDKLQGDESYHLVRKFPIYHIPEGGGAEITVGHLWVTATTFNLVTRMRQKLTTFFFFQAVKTFIVSFLILFVIRMLVTGKINQLAIFFAHAYDPSTGITRSRIPEALRGKVKDEIDDLISKINDMSDHTARFYLALQGEVDKQALLLQVTQDLASMRDPLSAIILVSRCVSRLLFPSVDQGEVTIIWQTPTECYTLEAPIQQLNRANLDALESMKHLFHQQPPITAVEFLDVQRNPRLVSLCHHHSGSAFLQLPYLPVKHETEKEPLQPYQTFLTTLASSLALALENICYLDQLFEKGKMEKDLEAAQLVQNALLPTEYHGTAPIRVSHYYNAASKVGGDWYDVAYDEKKSIFYVCAGDVTGHGMPAALLTGVLSGALRSQFGLHQLNGYPSPERTIPQLIIAANYTVNSTGLRASHLATMCFLAIDCINGIVYYSSCGHPPIYWIKSQDAQGISCPGGIIGMDRSPNFKLKSWTISPGDSLFIYSDGLVENQGADGKAFEHFKLRQCLRQCPRDPEKVREAVLLQGTSIWGDQEPADDAMFLVVQWLGSSNALLDRHNTAVGQST